MTNQKPLHEKGEKVYVVLKLWRASNGELTSHYERNSAIRVIKVFQLVSEGAVDSGTNDTYTNYTDVFGHEWLGFQTGYGLRFMTVNHDNYQYLLDGTDIAEDMKTELGNTLDHQYKTVGDEVAELNHFVVLQKLLYQYHLGNVTWEDISHSVPSFSGITREGVDEIRDEFIANFDADQKMFTNLLAELKKQTALISGQDFDEMFSIGPMVFMQHNQNKATGQEPHHHALLQHDVAIPSTSEKFKAHKTMTAIIDAFMVAIGGRINFKRKMYGEETPVLFAYNGHQVSAKYTEYTNLDGKHTQQFVAITAEDLDLPVHLHF